MLRCANLLVWSTIAVCFVCLLTGCSEQQWRELACPKVEVPAANVPEALRYKNWPDSKGSGSCVIASSCSCFEWFNRPDLAAKFRKTYVGGQTEKSILTKYRASKIPFVATKSKEEADQTGGYRYGDPRILELCSETRRACIIWYFPNHCVNFVGFSQWQGQEVAWLLDNNRKERFIPIPKNQFISEWRGFGGFAAIPWLTPAPSIPFQGYEVL
jgi:hypothetical protein